MAPDIIELEIFNDLSPHMKMQLRSAASLRELKKGDYIYMPGDDSDTVFVVAEGSVKTSKLSDNGKELTLGYHGKGEMFGEMALLEEEPRMSAAIAVNASKVWALPVEELMQVAMSSPAFALRLGTVIGRRRHELENRMENLVFRDVPARLANQLLSLVEKHGVEREGEIELTVRLSQLELANLIGATRETTSTALNELKRMGIIDTSHRKIIIRDMEALRDIEGFE